MGNYFRLLATESLYLCLAGQTHVKCANLKLVMEPSRTDVVRGPYVTLPDLKEQNTSSDLMYLLNLKVAILNYLLFR